MVKPQKVIFNKRTSGDLYSLLKKRVDDYFISNNLSKYGDFSLYVKTILLALAYLFITYKIFFGSLGIFEVILFYGALGLTKSFIGFNLVHDALHGSFSRMKWLNAIIGYWFDFNGTSSLIWKISHNQQHHIYTNIPGHDDDINKAILLRLNPSDKLYWFHKYQHIYAPILYCLICVNWIFYSDYSWFWKESKKEKIPFFEIALFLILKIANLVVFLFLPLALLSVPWWAVCLGYLNMLFCAGITIAIVFQLAHVVEKVQYFSPNEEGRMANNWATHEVLTTSNFSTSSYFLTHLIGGLNFQIEHHLFPQISHVHYLKISKIVRKTIEEFGLPYNEQASFWEAIKSHFRTLKALGCREDYVSAMPS